MKLLRRGNLTSSDKSDSDAAMLKERAVPTEQSSRQVSVGKGRPTPTRREAEGRRRGPVAPAPLNSKEARARKKVTRGSKEERKTEGNERRAAAADRRARMLAGEEKYLLGRDKGPVRAMARDIVDARRNLLGLFMPIALLLIVALFLSQTVQLYVTLAMLIMFFFMGAEGVYIGRTINNRVRERFPDTTDGGLKLGWYGFVRASQIRKMRAPKPRVSAGATV